MARGNSIIAAAIISVVTVVLSAAAHAEDCLGSPHSAALEGTRWYYRLDPTNRRKCWYVRAFNQTTQEARGSATLTHPAPSLVIPLPRPRPSTAEPSLPLNPSITDPSSEIAAETNPTLLVSGSAKEIKSSIPSESGPETALTSLATPTPDAADTPISVVEDGTPSPISKMPEAVAAPEATIEAPAPDDWPHAAPDKTSSLTSDTTARQKATALPDLNSKIVGYVSNAPPQITATIDDSVSPIPSDLAAELSTAAEPKPPAALTPTAVATVRTRPLLPDPMPPDRELTSLRDEGAGITVNPFYLVLALVGGLVGMLYYIIFRHFPGSGTRIGVDHPAVDYAADDPYNNPEFYRKLRQNAV
jgi:hypothetical protein